MILGNGRPAKPHHAAAAKTTMLPATASQKNLAPDAIRQRTAGFRISDLVTERRRLGALMPSGAGLRRGAKPLRDIIDRQS